jgi:hypothetical protein
LQTTANPSNPPIATAETDITRLAQAVIIQAAKDAASGDYRARAWLLDPETGDTWGAVAGLSWPHVVAWVLAGCIMPPNG